jgi:hypothetical protein
VRGCLRQLAHDLRKRGRKVPGAEEGEQEPDRAVAPKPGKERVEWRLHQAAELRRLRKQAPDRAHRKRGVERQELATHSGAIHQAFRVSHAEK